MGNRYLVIGLFIVVTGCFGGCSSDKGVTLTSSADWPEISAKLVSGGFTNPIDIGHGNDGTGRLFVVEQGGIIWIVMNGSRLATPFLDISDRVTPTGGEQGLLGLAFPPDFASKGHFYVNYTRRSDGSTVVARYLLTEDPDVADPGSEKILLTVQQPFGNHNGGKLAFGPDGFLYISTGDGGSGGDPMNNAQDVGTFLGKLLRIDVDSGADPYGIPPGNPFLGNPNALDEIWSLGLRNPWRFSFDRQTGDIYIADVGQSSLEEVNFQPSSSAGGENYGWKIMEGTRCFISPQCNGSGLTLPVFEYDHSLGDCSVTGGTVYRGLEFPPMEGIYFYGDFCSGRIWGSKRDGDLWENTLLLDTAYNISTFGEDEEGNLYLADYGRGDIYMIFAP